MTNYTTILESAAVSLGISTEQLLHQIADQAFRSASIELAAIIVFAALLVALCRYVRKMNPTDEDRILAGMLLIFSTIGFMTIVGIAFDEIISRLLNPNLWAIKQIIKR